MSKSEMKFKKMKCPQCMGVMEYDGVLVENSEKVTRKYHCKSCPDLTIYIVKLK